MIVTLEIERAERLLMTSCNREVWRDDAFEILISQITTREQLVEHGIFETIIGYFTYCYLAASYVKKMGSPQERVLVGQMLIKGSVLVFFAARRMINLDHKIKFESFAERLRTLADELEDAPPS